MSNTVIKYTVPICIERANIGKFISVTITNEDIVLIYQNQEPMPMPSDGLRDFSHRLVDGKPSSGYGKPSSGYGKPSSACRPKNEMV